MNENINQCVISVCRIAFLASKILGSMMVGFLLTYRQIIHKGHNEISDVYSGLPFHVMAKRNSWPFTMN